MTAEMVAACSGGESNEGKDGAYITVHFEDGPEAGLLAEVADDDVCDPRYWRFEEVHGRRPNAKVLFTDGVAVFIAEWPSTREGTLIDEDTRTAFRGGGSDLAAGVAAAAAAAQPEPRQHAGGGAGGGGAG
eukprot:CAMPEP_0179157128 /NCGR_PEP_ID=MMETSP0796-20121207/76633_1 /TAXON_ID=73915 /ORGANISM="Pyrodinium bahamense, Strain pbaha01" /LENGTH=130 /DNA_ID=CAMNT_0020858755 /DNA_START=44 /DNA_END=434 /DNA_ORIENTATION=-